MKQACLSVSKLALSILAFSSFLMCLNIQKEPQAKSEKPLEMAAKYGKWLEEEVIYIISANEREVFKSLRTDEEREGFIKTFWKRRDPTPNTPINECREEHYRRLEYANKNYFEGKAGWRTDRGRTYILFGPPDVFETNPGGGRGFLFDPSGPTVEFPSEVWTYRYIPGLKNRYGRIDLIFVNYYNSGSYQLTTDPALANALRNISVEARDVGYESDINALVPGQNDKNLAVNPLEQLTLISELTKSRGDVLEEMERSKRLRRLRGIVDANESLTSMPFIAQESFLRGGENLAFVPISIEIAGRDVSFKKVEDRYKGIVNFHIEVKDQSKTVYQVSDRLEMNLKQETYDHRLSNSYQYKHGLDLKSGEYSFHIVVWDEASSNVGYQDMKIVVPPYPQSEFGISDVILARSVRVIEVKKEPITVDSSDIPALKMLERAKIKVPNKVELTQRQSDPFTFGNLEISPNPSSTYNTNEELVFFYQIYNPVLDPAQRSASILIEHQVWQGDKLIAVIDKPQEAHILAEQTSAAINSGARFTLRDFASGQYVLLIRARDVHSNKLIEKKANFTVK